MIAVIQRVKKAKVFADGVLSGTCNDGLFVLLGVADGDTERDADALAKKILNLRVFCDENDKMNLSLKDVNGEMLIVSNFTLLAAYKKGNRPDYMGAAAPQEAKRLYEYFSEYCRRELRSIGCGVFGAHMEIETVCDGPVTITMDSRVLLAGK